MHLIPSWKNTDKEAIEERSPGDVKGCCCRLLVVAVVAVVGSLVGCTGCLQTRACVIHRPVQGEVKMNLVKVFLMVVLKTNASQLHPTIIASTTVHSITLHSTTHMTSHNTIQHNTIQYKKIQYNTNTDIIIVALTTVLK